jgi:hypothetical protein
MSGVLITACSIFPFSLRHGMITEHVTSLWFTVSKAQRLKPLQEVSEEGNLAKLIKERRNYQYINRQ